MKNLLVIAFLLIPFIGISQNTTTENTIKPINAFLGIKLGSPYTTVATALKAKGYTVNRLTEPTTMIVVENVKLGSHSGSLGVLFVDDKACKAVFFFAGNTDNQVIKLYDTIVQDIESVYGAPQRVTKSFEDPYEEGDGFEITAIKEGAAVYETKWEDKDKNYIIVDISEKPKVQVIYADRKLLELLNTRQRSKEKADF